MRVQVAEVCFNKDGFLPYFKHSLTVCRVYSVFSSCKRKMLGMSGSFRIPKLRQKVKKGHGLPSLDWNLLKNEKEIASGSFGTVYLATYGHDESKVIVTFL